MTLQEVQNQLLSLKETGFIPSRRRGPTGIGHTLEAALGLVENNIAIPDIGGRIELKATRKNSNAMLTLFTFNQGVWQLNQKEIIEKYGYLDDRHRKSLYSSVFYNKENPQNLNIRLDRPAQAVHLCHNSGALLATWSVYKIVGKFISKLERLLVVLASCRVNPDSGTEEFLFDEAYFLANPSPDNFLTAFADSQIAIDIRMHVNTSGTVRNHGTGFRVAERNIVNLYADRRKII